MPKGFCHVFRSIIDFWMNGCPTWWQPIHQFEVSQRVAPDDPWELWQDQNGGEGGA